MSSRASISDRWAVLRLLGLFQGLGELLRRCVRIEFLVLHGRLIGDVLGFQFVEGLGEILLGIIQFLGRLLGFGGRRLGFVFIQALLGRLHVLGSLVHLLRGIGGHGLHFLGDVLRLGR